MELPKNLKSKKLVLVGAGLIVVILVGFFVLKFMTSGGADAVPEKPRTAPRAARKISKPKQEEPKKSPLYQAMEALKDPFRADDPRAAELQDKLSLTQKEVEYLRAILEEKKLRQQIKEIEMSIAKADRTASPGSEVRVLSPEGKQKESKTKEERLVVKAIMITDEEESALVVSGSRKSWVHEGEYFDGWEVKEIRDQSVVFRKGGKTFVFFYDRPAISREGEP
jgi:type IV pilus biogenesis protein PilP